MTADKSRAREILESERTNPFEESRYSQFPETDVDDAFESLREHLSSKGITSPELAAERFIDRLERIAVPEFVTELITHDLASRFSTRALNADFGLPPSYVHYLLGLSASVQPVDGNTNFDFYTVLDSGCDIRRAVLSELIDCEVRRSPDELMASTSPLLREMTSGRYVHPNQYQEAAERWYTPHDDRLRSRNGFTIEQAIEFTRKLEKAVEVMLQTAIDLDFLETVPDIVRRDQALLYRFSGLFDTESPLDRRTECDPAESIGNTLRISRGTLERAITVDDQAAFESFLEYVTTELGSISGPFLPYDHNPLFEGGLIAHEESYFLPQIDLLSRVLEETFYFDLQNESDYRGRFTNEYGAALESWTADCLLDIFPDDTIITSAEYQFEDETTEVDLLIDHEEILGVVECKQKGLTLPTRKGELGGFDQLLEDLSRGIGAGSRQANRFLSELRESGELRIRYADGERVIRRDDERVTAPIVVLGEPYDMIGATGYTDLLSFEGQVPYVTDIFTLQSLSHHVSASAEFADYIDQRLVINNDHHVTAMDELDLYYEYEQFGLNEVVDVEAAVGTDRPRQMLVVHPDNPLREYHNERWFETFQ